MTEYPTSSGDQKTVMEALDVELTEWLAKTEPVAVNQSATTPPTQKHLETAWVAAGNTLPVEPDREFLWYDSRVLRGQYSALRDFMFQVAASHNLNEYSLNTNITGLSTFIWWEDDYHFIANILVKGVVSAVRMFLDGSYDVIAAGNIIGYSRVTNLAYYVGAANQIFSLDTLTGTPTGLTTTTAATLPMLYARDNGDLLFSDGNKVLKKRTGAGVVSTIIDVSATYTHADWYIESAHYVDASNILVVMQNFTTNDAGAFRVAENGTGFTILIAAAVGAVTPAKHYAVGDKFYYLNTVRTSMTNPLVLTISTGAAAADEPLDYGEAADAYRDALAEDVVKEAANIVSLSTAPAQYFGIQLGKVMTSLQRRLPSPNTRNWLLVTDTYTFPQPAYTWWVLADPVNAVYPGSTGRMFTTTVFHDGQPDYFRVMEVENDGQRKELLLDWSDPETQKKLLDYDIIQIQFDNWLQVADDSIRIQFNADTGSNYTYSQWTISASTIANTNGGSTTEIVLPGRFNATFMGGQYTLTFIDCRSTDSQRYALIEGGTQTGITTTLMRATLGVGIWHSTDMPSSIRIFLTGSGFFGAGVKVSLVAWKTKGRYRRTNGGIYDTYMG